MINRIMEICSSDKQCVCGCYNNMYMYSTVLMEFLSSCMNAVQYGYSIFACDSNCVKSLTRLIVLLECWSNDAV